MWYVATGGDLRRLNAELPDLIASPPIFVSITLACQLALLVTAVAFSHLSPILPRGGLGFNRPGLPPWEYLVIMFGSIGPFVVGAGVLEAVSLVMPPDDTFERVITRVTPLIAVPFILFVALVPGVIEEAFFRGYIQRRLLKRWPAWAAIGTTALLFALMHFYPANIAFAFVVGLWLGAVAWGVGSVWPAVLCHAFINTIAVIWNLGARAGVIPDPLPSVAIGAIVLLAISCFLASVRLLAREPSKQLKDADVVL
jgi:membrane protease YdiL (CAAX protease family)